MPFFAVSLFRKKKIMETITLAKIDRIELLQILFAARWQMKEWEKNSETSHLTEGIWKNAINATKYIEKYIKDFPADEYYLQNTRTIF